MADEDSEHVKDSDGPPERGIFDGFSGYVSPTDDDWMKVLADGLIVVDTNVLLNLYRYNQKARDSLLTTLQKFGARLWIPHQVMDEFWRNRESALEDPDRQLQQSVTALRSDLEKGLSDLRHWIKRVSLDRTNAIQLEETLTKAHDEVIGRMEAVVESSGVEMERDTSKDWVVAALDKLLQGKVGGPLNSHDLTAAINEGKRRIAGQIPPGYKDKKKESRGDDSEIGDYLVWVQLIKEAKIREKDVLLITGDVKEDWWRTRNKIPLGPRNELTEELLRETHTRLYMLRPDRLLTYAREFMQVAVSEDSVQNIEMVNAQSESDEIIQTLTIFADSNPKKAIWYAWAELDMALETLLQYPSHSQQTTTMQMLTTLSQDGLISQEILRTMRELNSLRNEIAHGSEAEISQEDALKFILAAKNVFEAIPIARAPVFQSKRFEQAIINLVLTSGFEIPTPDSGGDYGYAFLVTSRSKPQAVVAVELKYRLKSTYTARDLEISRMRLSKFPRQVTSLVVVVNSLRSEFTQSFNTSNSTQGAREERYMEVVQWRDSNDDHLVARALMRAMR